jgi:hypothetical protein
MKRVLSTAALAGVLVLAGGGAAVAATYPAPVPGVAVSDGTVQPGEPFTFSGTGFTPGEQINITATNEAPVAGVAGGGGAGRAGTSVGLILPLEVKTASVTADAKGAFSTQITLTETGTYTITATGAESGRTQTATVTVTEPVVADVADGSNSAGAGLADTGAAGLFIWGAAGIAALGAGAVTVISVRRKAGETAA